MLYSRYACSPFPFGRLLGLALLLGVACPGQEIVLGQGLPGSTGGAFGQGNANGVIAGQSVGHAGGPLPFLWDSNANGGVGAAIAVPLPAGYSSGQAVGVNDAVQVAGIARNGTTYNLFLWDSILGTTVGPAVPSFVVPTQLRVNNAMQVASGQNFIWHPSTGITAVPGRTLDINDYGQVVGQFGTWGYLWTPGSRNGTTGLSLTFASGRVTSINTCGQIAGDDVGGTFIWTPSTPNTGATGTKVYLPPKPTDTAANHGAHINDRGWVGYGATGAAVLWIPDEDNGNAGAWRILPLLTNNGYAQIYGKSPSTSFNGLADSQPVFWRLTSSASSGGNDVLEGGSGTDTLDGGQGDDILRGVGGADNLLGGVGDDLLQGGDGDDILDGGTGIDRLVGGDGNDTMDGGPGDDILIGGAGDDILDCGPSESVGDDVLDGGAGNDTILGGQGNDTLIGGTGDDSLDGRSGDDTVDPGQGIDAVQCGPGVDTLRLRAGDVPAGSTETSDCGQGSDTLVLIGITAAQVTGTLPTLTITDPQTGGVYVVLAVESVVYQ